MLPMFATADELRDFCAIVDGRAPVVALLETSAPSSRCRGGSARAGCGRCT